MKKKLQRLSIFVYILIYVSSNGFAQKPQKQNSNGANDAMEVALAQYNLLAEKAGKENKIPRTLTKGGEYHWASDKFDWTEGFYPGTCWYFYALTKNEKWRTIAEKVQSKFEAHKLLTTNHDLGFIFNASYGNGYKLTKNKAFKEVMIAAGNALITRFNPNVGCIQSWEINEGWQAKRGWKFPVIIDNMMNLELLFELSDLTGNPKYKEVAIAHANTTLKNHYRPDNSSFHVVDYDPETGKALSKVTAQGYQDSSTWARGQAWGLYGYTVCYRYTKNPIYLKQAENIANFIINDKRIPKDRIPFWDYDAPNIPNEPKDASAAAITASALFELSTYSNKKYFTVAEEILNTLSSKEYLAEVGSNKYFILKHSVGSIPHKNEIDVPLNYADYYFIEALMRKQKMKENVAPKGISGSEFKENESLYWQNYLKTRAAGTDLLDKNTELDSKFIPLNYAYAGYHSGDKTLPKPESTKDFKVFKVTDYGAIPNDDISDRFALNLTIQAAKLFRKTNEGKGIIIYFGEGTFILNDQKDAQLIDSKNKKQLTEGQTIFFELSNLIIRGAGEKKTTLLAKTPLLAVDESKLWTTPYLLNTQKGFKQELVGRITESYRGGSTMSIKVDAIKALKAGDFVELVGTIKNEEKIKAAVLPYELEVDPNTKKSIWSDLSDGLIKKEKHKIAKIEGNVLYFTTPIAHDIDNTDDWKVSQIKPIEEFGVEDLTFSGNWHEDFVHHKDAYHDGGFSLLELNNCTNSWVRNVTFKDFCRGLNVSQCSNVTLENITLVGKQGHQTVSVNHSNNVLSKNIFDNANGWHAPGISNYAISNVYFNMTYDSTSMSDLHGKQSMINLFDNTKGGWVLGRWGAATINQPNHLGGLMYWNHENTTTSAVKFKAMNPNSEYGRLIMPHLIGLHGQYLAFESQSTYAKSIKAQNKAEYKTMLSNEPQAYLESIGKAVFPQSLYEAQYHYRQSLKNRNK